MTLTREALLAKATPRYQRVSVEGWGEVLLKSITQTQLTRREISYAREPKELERSAAYLIIDQVMTTESEPMFTVADVDKLGEIPADVLLPLQEAIAEFNGEAKKKASDESSDT